ncbi:unnamed protein product [Phytophthora fragariaefolia]|uniref:Unnamed protein product n=1 Tax=Phytophthora fragariaefolia TaxID=1490495 RepID=A0A9W6YE18_9STRA|nr:unnamed protein product [Phytophthora fragariaefolia]
MYPLVHVALMWRLPECVAPLQNVNRKFKQRTKLSVPVFFVGFPSTFDSWDAFHASFDHFQRESFQQFSKRASSSVTVRDKQIEQSKTLVPTKWGFYSKTLKCTHAQKHQPRGTGKRKHSKVRGTKCTATVNVRVAATPSGTWELRVSASGNHNHDLNEHLWENYAENRTITDPHLKSDVAVLHKAGASARGILQYLRERTVNLRRVIQIFKQKKNNPEWVSLRVFMTDKAVHKKDVLREEFPDATQLICQWHVITWLKKQAERLAGPVKKHVKALMALMVYAKAQNEYEDARGAMLEKLGGSVNHLLFRTFMDNWGNTQDAWVSFKRGNIPHLTNNTNNRIESKWGKIKDVIKGTFTIDQVLSTLITQHEHAEEEYFAEYDRVGGPPSGFYEDLELSALSLQMSKFAFNLVSDQYALAIGASADYDMEPFVASYHVPVVSLFALRAEHPGVGVVHPSFHQFVLPEQKRRVAGGCGASDPKFKRVVGVLNTDLHWVAFLIDRKNKVRYMFDPLQSDANYKIIEKIVRQAVEGLLDVGSKLLYGRFSWCKQQDSTSCGIWCLAVLEMLITDSKWDDCLYRVVPYLRMRYLYKAIAFIEKMAIMANE